MATIVWWWTRSWRKVSADTITAASIVSSVNERGKGDHCHLDGAELAYEFSTVEQLIEDFIAEVEKRRT